MTPLLALALSFPLLRVPQDVAAGASPLERRAREVAALVKQAPEWPDELFDASFVKQAVDEKRLTGLMQRALYLLGKQSAAKPREK